MQIDLKSYQQTLTLYNEGSDWKSVFKNKSDTFLEYYLQVKLLV